VLSVAASGSPTTHYASLKRKGWCPQRGYSGSGGVQRVRQYIMLRSTVGDVSYACMSSGAAGGRVTLFFFFACLHALLQCCFNLQLTGARVTQLACPVTRRQTRVTARMAPFR
jgi:hypothetical protein